MSTVPDWLLERYALGEITDEQRARVEAEPDVTERLAQLRRSDAEILSLHPRLRRATAKPSRAWGYWALPALAMAGVVLMLQVPREAPSEDRSKGLRPALQVYRLVAQGAEPLAPNAISHAGERLQVEYVAGSASYGAVFSVDGRGHLTQHWPDGDAAAALAPHALLPFAYELDDAPRFERFVFVYSPRSFALAEVKHAAADADPSTLWSLSAPLEQVSVTVRKP